MFNMSSKIAVKVSGSIVSSLLFEHVNSRGDQEGFLLGELVTRITRTISDSHMSAEKEETSIHIYTIVPCDEQSFSFYDCAGRIEERKLSCYLQDRKKDVIGWYRFRRNTPLEISLREQAVHENLCKVLAPGFPQFFLFGIFTSCDTHGLSTYAFDHIILRLTRMGYERSSLNIINLGTTSHAEYLLHPHDATDIYIGCFRDVVNTINVEEVASVSQVLDMHKGLRCRLESMKEEVTASEEKLGFLCLDIAELEAKIASLQVARAIEAQHENLEQPEEEEVINEPTRSSSDEHLNVPMDDSPNPGPSVQKQQQQIEHSEENVDIETKVTLSDQEVQNKGTCHNTEEVLEKDCGS